MGRKKETKSNKDQALFYTHKNLSDKRKHAGKWYHKFPLHYVNNKRRFFEDLEKAGHQAAQTVTMLDESKELGPDNFKFEDNDRSRKIARDGSANDPYIPQPKKKLRTGQILSNEDFAEELGCDRSRISRFRQPCKRYPYGMSDEQIRIHWEKRPRTTPKSTQRTNNRAAHKIYARENRDGVPHATKKEKLKPLVVRTQAPVIITQQVVKKAVEKTKAARPSTSKGKSSPKGRVEAIVEKHNARKKKMGLPQISLSTVFSPCDVAEATPKLRAPTGAETISKSGQMLDATLVDQPSFDALKVYRVAPSQKYGAITKAELVAADKMAKSEGGIPRDGGEALRGVTDRGEVANANLIKVGGKTPSQLRKSENGGDGQISNPSTRRDSEPCPSQRDKDWEHRSNNIKDYNAEANEADVKDEAGDELEDKEVVKEVEIENTDGFFDGWDDQEIISQHHERVHKESQALSGGLKKSVRSKAAIDTRSAATSGDAAMRRFSQKASTFSFEFIPAPH